MNILRIKLMIREAFKKYGIFQKVFLRIHKVFLLVPKVFTKKEALI